MVTVWEVESEGGPGRDKSKEKKAMPSSLTSKDRDYWQRVISLFVASYKQSKAETTKTTKALDTNQDRIIENHRTLGRPKICLSRNNLPDYYIGRKLQVYAEIWRASTTDK